MSPTLFTGKNFVPSDFTWKKFFLLQDMVGGGEGTGALPDPLSLWPWSVNFDIFMDNYFTFFRLLTHLRVNNIRATRVLNKDRWRKFTIIGDKHLQKKERCHFEKRTFSKKAV